MLDAAFSKVSSFILITRRTPQVMPANNSLSLHLQIFRAYADMPSLMCRRRIYSKDVSALASIILMAEMATADTILRRQMSFDIDADILHFLYLRRR